MNTTDLELRIERLERRVNRYRLASVVLGLGLVGLAGVAATAPTGPVSQEVRTHKLVVVNETGKEAAHIVAAPHGGLLTLLNYEDYPVVRMGVGDKGGKLSLLSPKGESYVTMSSEDNGGEVMLQDKAGQKNIMRAVGAGTRPAK
jgi:hypothetical protein